MAELTAPSSTPSVKDPTTAAAVTAVPATACRSSSTASATNMIDHPDERLGRTLGSIIHLAVDCLGPSTDASFSVLSPSAQQGHPVVWSSERGHHLDAAQQRCGRGPACEALGGGREAGGPLPDRRWPELSELASASGVRYAWSLPVGTGDLTVGTLTLYREPARTWAATQAHTARVLAEIAGVVLADAGTVAELTRGNDTLQQALETRTVIGQAQGILMARQHIDAAAAFDVLRRASQRSNRKLRDIAADLVAGVGRQLPPRCEQPRKDR